MRRRRAKKNVLTLDYSLKLRIDDNAHSCGSLKAAFEAGLVKFSEDSIHITNGNGLLYSESFDDSLGVIKEKFMEALKGI